MELANMFYQYFSTSLIWSSVILSAGIVLFCFSKSLTDVDNCVYCGFLWQTPLTRKWVSHSNYVSDCIWWENLLAFLLLTLSFTEESWIPWYWKDAGILKDTKRFRTLRKLLALLPLLINVAINILISTLYKRLLK